MDISKYTPQIPALPADKSIYELTPEALSVIVNEAFMRGYDFAKELFSDTDATQPEVYNGFLGKV